MKKLWALPLLIFFLVSFSSQASADDLKSFCSQTCGLWPKMCATGTLCLKLCKTPQRIMKGCYSNKVPVDTKLPDIAMTKQQFCQALCGKPPLVCAVMTYCTQSCGTKPESMKACIEQGISLDTYRPKIIG